MIISMVTLIMFRYLPYARVRKTVEKIPVCGILVLFIPIWLMYYLGNFGGFSLGKNLMLYVIGYYVLSSDAILEKMEKKIVLLVSLCVAGTIVSVLLYYYFSYYGDLWIHCVGWISVLAVLVLARKFLIRKTKFTEYFNKASYPVYILHQSVLVAFAYYFVQICDGMAVRVIGICMGSFCLTIVAYHLLRKIRFLRKIIGMR